MAIEVKAESFDKEVMNSDLPVLVDFWAPWCAPCQMVTPHVEALAEKYTGKIKVCKVNIDEAANIATQFAIMSIPALMIFKDGKIMEKRVGVMGPADLEKFIYQYIA